MASEVIAFPVNLRRNNNQYNNGYGKYYPEADTKEPLNLKGFARHIAEHGKLVDYPMAVLVLQNIVNCLKEMIAQGQPVKLDGFGTFSPSVDGQKNGKTSVEAAVAAGADNLINGVHINFNPENSKGEKLTSRAFKDECLFEFGYLVESEIRTVNGKDRRVQKKTPISYILAPAADQTGGGD